jgi:hypothetical protein
VPRLETVAAFIKPLNATMKGRTTMPKDLEFVLEEIQKHGVVIWPLVADIFDSFRLAMQHEGIDDETAQRIITTVSDYASNHYGDN